MVALEVSVNGKRRYVAGHIDGGIWHVHVQLFGLNPQMPPTAILHSAVAVRAGDGQLDTLPYPSDRLSVGDEVTVRIVEVDSADPPSDAESKPKMMSFASGSAGRR